MAPSAPEPGTAARGPAFADAVADDASNPLPSAAQLERLAREDPVAFLENCLRRYQRNVKGYTCTFLKQERIGDKVQRTETIDVAFREEPYSVLFHWVEGARLAERALFVEGDNDGMLLVRPEGRLARRVAGDVVSRDPDGKDAKQSGRYTLKEFGLKKGALRTLHSWKTAKEKDALHVEFVGEKKVKEAGDRVCYTLHRDQYPRPEDDGVTEVTIYIDKETWLQVGAVLKGEGGKLIASYYFRDIKLNPEFKAEQFTRAALVPAP